MDIAGCLAWEAAGKLLEKLKFGEQLLKVTKSEKDVSTCHSLDDWNGVALQRTLRRLSFMARTFL
ncbi:MAG: hypothetical protein KatS3mg110_3491 [Pirellulaceae bacterium]|nr:MAG: hypothetical protein KatS3mg110_3491 [Pirellulaceae bacterium]